MKKRRSLLILSAASGLATLLPWMELFPTPKEKFYTIVLVGIGSAFLIMAPLLIPALIPSSSPKLLTVSKFFSLTFLVVGAVSSSTIVVSECTYLLYTQEKMSLYELLTFTTITVTYSIAIWILFSRSSREQGRNQEDAPDQKAVR
jgi:hypothetical protein